MFASPSCCLFFFNGIPYHSLQAIITDPRNLKAVREFCTFPDVPALLVSFVALEACDSLVNY